jgi:hypothetical protein
VKTREKAVLVALLAFFAARTLFLIFDKSETTDEVSFHAVNGYAYLVTRDFRMSPATPPLAREWMALPWLLARPAFHTDKPSWEAADSVPFAVEFFYGENRGSARLLLALSRLMVWVLAMGLAAAVFAWGRALFGTGAGLLGLGFLAFCPTTAAHSALATVDVPAALFYFLTAAFLYAALERPSGPRFPAAAAAALGLGLAVKYTAVLLVPVFLVLCVRRAGWARGLGWTAAALGVALGVVWAAYFFETKPLLAGVPRVDEKIGYITRISDALTFGNAGARDFFTRTALNVPVPLASWLLGLAGIARSHQADYLHFFRGEWIQGGVWYHYLFAFAVKTPLGFLAALAARALVRRGAADLYLLLPAGVLFAATLFDTTGVGIRYLLPALPLLFVWAGGLWPAPGEAPPPVSAPSAPRSARNGVAETGGGEAAAAARRAACGFLLGAHALSSLGQFGSPIAYFNALAGGPREGHRFLRYSDLDWGQELRNLGRYARREGIPEVRTYLFGTTDAAFHGIREARADDSDFRAPRPAVYAISANYFDRFEWTKGLEPTARIGHAIFVYDMRKSR